MHRFGAYSEIVELLRSILRVEAASKIPARGSTGSVLMEPLRASLFNLIGRRRKPRQNRTHVRGHVIEPLVDSTLHLDKPAVDLGEPLLD